MFMTLYKEETHTSSDSVVKRMMLSFKPYKSQDLIKKEKNSKCISN